MFILAGSIVLAASAYATTVTAEEFRQMGLQPPKQRVESIDFELQDLSGTTRRLSDFNGKVVFLNFWATWCGPCRFEMPSMEKLYQRFKARGLEIAAVNLQEDRDSVKHFVEEYELSFPVLLDTTGRIGATYGARSIPTSRRPAQSRSGRQSSEARDRLPEGEPERGPVGSIRASWSDASGLP